MPRTLSTSAAHWSITSPLAASVSFPPTSTSVSWKGKYSESSRTKRASHSPSVRKISSTSWSRGRFCIAMMTARCSALPSSLWPPLAASRLKKLRCVPARPCAAPGKRSVSCTGTSPPDALGRPMTSLPSSRTPPWQRRPPSCTMPPARPVPQDRKRPTAFGPSGVAVARARPEAPHIAEASPSLTSSVEQEPSTITRPPSLSAAWLRR
mmetsp:Transcript_10438/g.29028  ORF Transcript_10438/g.29028 Transcript_10438/m.29028 type:complete len:209 (+) Transcript_10438:195-821(+)